jgi:hypothetical protein
MEADRRGAGAFEAAPEVVEQVKRIKARLEEVYS